MPFKVTIPADRTRKQPLLAYCRNPACWQNDEKCAPLMRFEFALETGNVECPRCRANEPPMVGILVLTHLLIKDPRGPILGAEGWRYRMGCDAQRAYLATMTNQEAASGDPHVVNCPGCLKTPEAQAVLEGAEIEKEIFGGI